MSDSRGALRRSRGFSVVEILVANVSALLVIAALATLSGTHRRVARTERIALDLEESVRRSLSTIAQHVRSAGFDPLPTGSFDGLREGIAEATPERVSLQADLAGTPDGDIDPTSIELTTIYRSASSGSIILTTGNRPDPLSGPRQANAGSLSFRYFDSCGVELVPGPSGLDPLERPLVARIEFSLRLSEGSLTTTGIHHVALRNRAAIGCAP